MENKTENIIKSFLRNDNYRPILNKPFEINGKIYATDSYCLIRVDKDKCDFILEPHDTPPNCESVVPSENINILIDVAKNDFEQYKTEDETSEIGDDIECDTCNGFGEVEWEFEHYTRDFDCPVCEGSGYSAESRTVKTGNKTYDNYFVKVRNTYLDIHKFDKLLQVKELLNEPIYLIHESEPNKPVLFRVGIFEILIMPMIYNYYGNNDNKVIDLKL